MICSRCGKPWNIHHMCLNAFCPPEPPPDEEFEEWWEREGRTKAQEDGPMKTARAAWDEAKLMYGR